MRPSVTTKQGMLCLALLCGCRSPWPVMTASWSTSKSTITREQYDANESSTQVQQPAVETEEETREPFVRLASADQADSLISLAEASPNAQVSHGPGESNSTNNQADYTLDTLVQLALENNPAIRQAMASVHKGVGLRDQVGRRPNPVVAYNGEQVGDAQTDQHMLTISQDFITANKLGWNQDVMNRAVQAQLWEVEVQRRRVTTDVRVTYFDALAAQRRLTLAREFRDVVAKGVRLAESRKAALEGSQPEVLQTEIQLQEVELVQQQAEIDFHAAWYELAATVGLPDLPIGELGGELPKVAPVRDWESLYHQLLTTSPEVQAASLRASKAAANVQRQDIQAIPNINVALGVGTDVGTGSQLGRIGVGVPLPLYNQNEGNLAAAQAEYCRACQDLERLKLNLKARLARTAQNHDSALAAVKRYDQHILPKAEQSLELSEQAYASGEFSYLQVLIARRTYFDANLQAVESRRRLAQAAAQTDGMLLSGGLSEVPDLIEDDSLRGQALDQQ